MVIRPVNSKIGLKEDWGLVHEQDDVTTQRRYKDKVFIPNVRINWLLYVLNTKYNLTFRFYLV